MKKMTTTRFIALLLFISLFNTSKAQVHPDESLQLVNIYNTNCNSGCTLSWDFNQPVTTWEGIIIENNRITEIQLFDKGLSGNIPNPDFPHLKILNLNENNFTGIIPDFSNLPNLEQLYLQENQLDGPIPDFSNLPNLKGFSFYNCELTGTIPDFSNLPELLWFYLDNNNLNGAVPNFSNLPELRELHARQNSLEGRIPDFDNLPNLEKLHLSVNDLTGEIPELAQCPNLTDINLAYNRLTGHIPPTFADLSNLTELRLDHNQLGCCYDANLTNLCTQLNSTSNTNGYISDGNDFIIPWEGFCNTGTGICLPDLICPSDSLVFDSLELVNFYNTHCDTDCTLNWDFTQPVHTWEGITLENNWVTEIDLTTKGLSGDVPNPNFPYLNSLYLGENNFTGQIPDFDSLPNLKYLYLYKNPLNSTVPDFSNLPNLAGFSFFACGLTGTIPNFSNLPELLWFYLDNNELTGTVPNLSNTPKLIDFFALQNNLEGTIPNFDNLPNLEKLYLGVNDLEGGIPDFAQCPNITHLNLSYNEISGDIHSIINNLDSLTILILNKNRLNDTISPEIGNLVNLETASLSNNQFTGNIPTAIQNLIKLESLGLHKNQLSGDIPDLSNLEALSLEKNNFTHEDIVTNYNSNHTNISTFTYSPQYYGNEQFHTDTVGATVILSPDPVIPYENPSIKWLQNDKYKTSYNLNDTTYVIPSLDTIDIGVYQYRFVDSTLTPLVEFHSFPVNNYVMGLDLSGNPVIPGQLIIDYGHNASYHEIDSIRTELENEYGGSLIDSCGCSVLIDLWEFNNDNIDAVREIFGLHSRTDRDDESTDIDGGHDVGLNSKTQQGDEPENGCDIFSPDYENGEQIIIHPYDTLSYGTDTIIIAITDSGIPLSATHIKVNEAEYNGIPGEDDDNNGYIDDIHSINFADDTISGFHGEAVISSITNNIPADMNIQVMPIKTFDGEGTGTLFDLLCGIYYGIDNGADIVNISAGYIGDKSAVFKNALLFGQDKDVLFVVSAGNDTLNIDTIGYWPASFARDSLLMSTVITTAAVDDSYEITDYSNMGDSTVTIAAPGAIYTEDGCLVGTSFSAPLVALGLAMEKSLNADRNHIAVRNDFIQRMDTSDSLSPYIRDGRVLRVTVKRNDEANCQLIPNGDFSNGTTGWNYWNCDVNISEGQCHISDIQEVSDHWNAALVYNDLTIEQSKQYEIRFNATSIQNSRILRVRVGPGGNSQINYASENITLNIDSQYFKIPFTMQEPSTTLGRLQFYIGTDDTELILDNVELVSLSGDCVELREGLSNETISNYIVFPNPTSGTLNVSFDLPNNYDSGIIRLFDLNGKLLLEHREAMLTQNQFRLDLNNIPTGVYLLRINIGEYMLTHKVIKSHR